MHRGPIGAGDAPLLLYVVNEAFFFLSHRLASARAAQAAGWRVEVAAPPDHVWAPRGFSVAEVERAGFKFHPIPLSRRGMNPVQEARTLFALLRLYRKLRPTLVHHLTIKPVLYGGCAARVAGVPAVVNAITGLGQVFTETGVVADARRQVVQRLLRFSLGHPRSRIILQNDADARRLRELGLTRGPDVAVVIRGSGVDLERFLVTPSPAGVPIVVLAARLIWEKGVREFVEAAERLHTAGVPARFVLVGDTQPSNPRSVPAATLDAWHAAGTVEWWGFRADMDEVLAQASIVCLPSTYGEGVPKVLLEACAAGRPIVTTSIAGCADAVQEGVNGFLVHPGDVGMLTSRIRTLLDDPALRTDMGLAGRRLAEASFDQGAVGRRTVGVYAGLVGGRAGVLGA